ncbi:MAG: hypothetical protein ACOZDY_17105 [Pseudomonadota bacterium]
MIRGHARPLWVLAAAALMAGCASTQFTNIWKDPNYVGGPFKKIVVMGVSGEDARRRTFEDIFTAKLRAAGVEAVPSYTLVPENGKVDKERLRAAVQKAGADGALVTRLVSIDHETRYSPGYVSVVPAVGYYRDFYGYYSSAWTYYTPPQVYQYDVVTLETNLWDVTKESLVWSATTETFAPGEFRREVAAFSDLVVGALREKRLI